MNILDNKHSVKERLIKFAMLFPLFWSFSGLFLYNDGKKELTTLVILVLFIRLFFIGYKGIWNNIKSNKLLWIMGANLLFSLIAYATYGFNSSKFRMLAVLFVYLSILPYDYLKGICYKKLIWLLSVITLLFLLLQGINGHFSNRGEWDINPIRYATVCAFLVIANLYYLFVNETRKDKGISFVVSLFPLSVVLLSQSRGPWLALIIGLLALFFLMIKRKKISYKVMIILLLGGGAMLAFFQKPIEQRIEQTLWEVQKVSSDNLNTSIGLRLQMWKSAFIIIEQHWLTGVGNNSTAIKQELANKGIITDTAATFRHFHNQYINDLAKYGILGLILTLSLVIYPLIKGRRHLSYPLILLLISVYMVAALTNMPFRNSHPLGFYLISLYLLLPIRESDEQ